MTKAELVRRTAKRSGVPDSEAKIFFEMFLRLISKQILHGNGIKVKGIGTFRLRKGKIRKITPGKGPEFIYTDLVVFSESVEETEHTKDQLLFSVPQAEEDDFISPDYHFSLSIGKPVIPIKGLKHSEFFIPPGGQELRRLLFSKAEKLFNSSERIRKENEEKDFLVIKPEQGTVVPETVKKPEEPPVININKLSWSGEDINKEIEKESLLDIDRSYEHGLSDEEPDLKDIVKRHSGDLPGAEEFDKQKENFPDLPPPVNPALEKDPVTDKFERVRSFSGARDKNKSVNRVNEEKNKEDKTAGGYAPVKSKSPLPVMPEKREGQVSYSGSKDKIVPEPVKKDKKRSSSEEPEHIEKDYSRRRTKAAFIVVFTLLIFSVAAAVIFFTPGLNIFSSGDGGINKNTIAAVKPVIIERSFNIPVTYPYDKSLLDESDFSFEPFSIVSGKEIQENRAQNNAAEVKETEKESAAVNTGLNQTVHTDIIPEKIKDNIYKYNDVFVVQVSSWKSFRKAESEVERFNEKGYAAFLEEATLRDKGIYYRVRVGNFSELKEAEDFLRKNI
jgi:nucleoid DNA-binding protein